MKAIFCLLLKIAQLAFSVAEPMLHFKEEPMALRGLRGAAQGLPPARRAAVARRSQK